MLKRLSSSNKKYDTDFGMVLYTKKFLGISITGRKRLFTFHLLHDRGEKVIYNNTRLEAGVWYLKIDNCHIGHLSCQKRTCSALYEAYLDNFTGDQ